MEKIVKEIWRFGLIDMKWDIDSLGFNWNEGDIFLCLLGFKKNLVKEDKT